MKKFGIRKLLCIVLAVVLVVGVVGGVAALAGATDPQVLFDGGDKEFKFNNAQKYGGNTNVDLFRDIKGAMPGDSFTQTITVGAENIGADTVTMSLKAQNPDAGYLKLLGQDTTTPVANPATLTVSYDGKEITGDLASGVSLGSFSNNQQKDITVKFELPLDAGNELKKLVASIQWVFTATIIPYVGPGPGPDPIDPDPVPLPDLTLDRTNHYGYIVGRGGGGVQPADYITRAEVATIFFRLLTDASRAEKWMQTNPYTDVPTDKWYNNAVSTLTNGGALEGYEDGTFLPDNYITRAEFATLAVRFYDAVDKVYSVDAFNDIADHWARNEINRAAELGLIEGDGDGSFRPQDYISRAEAMQLTNNILERRPVKEHLLDGMITWVDNVDTGIWYYATVQEATNSHDYLFSNQTRNEKGEIETRDPLPGEEIYEVWTEILPVRDWEALEVEWSDAYSGIKEGVPPVEAPKS